MRIARAQPDVEALVARDSNQPAERCAAARALVSKLISHSPEERPSAADARKHPLFWSAAQQLAFVREASDRLEAENESFWKQVNAVAPSDQQTSSPNKADKRNWRRNNSNNDNNNNNNSSSSSNNKNNSNDNNNNNGTGNNDKKKRRPKRPAILNDIDALNDTICGSSGWRNQVPAELVREAKQHRCVLFF